MTREEVYATRPLANRVKRYACWPTIYQQTVGEHSCRVAQIYVEIFGLPRAEVLYYAIWHDGGEQTAGDPPFPIKTIVPEYKAAHAAAERIGFIRLGLELPELTPLEKVRLRICDLLEMWEFGSIEVKLGNQYGAPVAQATLASARTCATETDLEQLDNWVNRRKI